MSETIEFIGSIDKIRFQANDSTFKIVTVKISKLLEGNPKENMFGDVVFKGEMAMLSGDDYYFKGLLEDNEKYGPQYKLLFSRRDKPVEKMSKEDFRRFLHVLSARWAPSINKKFDNPKTVFEEHDVEALTSIEGIGIKTARALLKKYESQKDYSAAYVEFAKWGFTTRITRKIVDAYKSVEKAVETIKANPYDLIDVVGIGFKTIDKKALEFGIAENDPRRVKAFIMDYFDKCATEGSSWVTPKQLKAYLAKNIFNCDTASTFQWIEDSSLFVVMKIDNETRITRKIDFDAEQLSAVDLMRLSSFSNNTPLKNVDKTIQQIETSQGFKYSDEQISGIHKMLDNQVSVLRGPGGVGKTSCLNAVVKVLSNNNLRIATCALSGKAADNLRQITGNKGKTIHRLIGINESGVTYNSKNPLPYDVIILDELSMVNVHLFSKLLEAIGDGARLIMVGDSAQLDAIGVGVMRGIVNSNVIPVITLRRIHRQAQDSAIVTHSLTYRTGKMPQVTEKDSWHRLGINKDLGYVFENPDNEDKIMDDAFMVYQQMMKKYDVASIQLLTPMTSNCFALNNRVQEIANPKSKSKNEYVMYPNSDYSYILREGDKVLNTSNNYDTISANNEAEILPIFNGNTGIIEKIDIERDKKGKIVNAYFTINFDGVGRVLLKEADIKHIQLGYAMTVHKSQGSTIPCVIIALPFQFVLNSRELLYTALTRASDECYLLTSMRTLKATIKKTSGSVNRVNLDYFLKRESRNLGEKNEY